MKKFECAQCYKKCQAMVNIEPKFCLLFGDKADWHEVKEGTTQQFGNSEQLPSNPRNLPDWVKVGECMYLPEKGKYFKITEDFMNVNLIGEKLTDILSGKIVQARKRPFNADEMKALVGKILTHKQTGDLTLVTDFINEYDKDLDYHYSTVFAFGENYTDGDLMDDCTIDGKPCYVLEHLENGEWVE